MTAWTAAPDPDLSRDPFDVWSCPRDDAHGPHRWWLKRIERTLGIPFLAYLHGYHCTGRRPIPARPPAHDPWCRSRDPIWADDPTCDCRLAAQPPSAGPWAARGATNTPTDDSQATRDEKGRPE